MPHLFSFSWIVRFFLFFFFWGGGGLVLYVPVNSYGHVETVSSPDRTFCWAVNQYFVYILSFVTENNPS